MDDMHITLAHGNGGRFMRELIEEVFIRHLACQEGQGVAGPDTRADAVPIDLPTDRGEVLITTDGFTVKPLEFPGGDIGSLAVHGTVNDLSVAGADPIYLTLNCFIEEGVEIALLERLAASLARAARESGVRVVAGDTKVVSRGEGGGVYFATTGVGVRPAGLALGMDFIRPADRVMVSGPVGDHGTAVMLARGEFGLRGTLVSDAASVWPITRRLREVEGVRFMRDPTRGGLATVIHEIARETGYAVHLREPAIPVRDPVRTVCEILGYDPLYLACEGRVVAVTAPEAADAALVAMADSGCPGCEEAAIIGTVEGGTRDDVGRAVMTTELGGERLLMELEDDPLPRIC